VGFTVLSVGPAMLGGIGTLPGRKLAPTPPQFGLFWLLILLLKLLPGQLLVGFEGPPKPWNQGLLLAGPDGLKPGPDGLTGPSGPLLQLPPTGL
jgi:hypothetical protein